MAMTPKQEHPWDRAARLFQEITWKLQKCDREKGRSKHLYTRSYKNIIEGRDLTHSTFKFSDDTTGYLSLTDILDDALNMGYINQDDWDLIYNEYKIS
jgi:hypothetical protein